MRFFEGNKVNQVNSPPPKKKKKKKKKREKGKEIQKLKRKSIQGKLKLSE
jgi:hypothetical protein